MTLSTTSSVRLPNINIGVLGHVDSGKTSLCRALSTQLSTSALDKNPQSQQRGITLELGFSAFYIPIDRLRHIDTTLYNDTNIDRIQVCLVDCPGHASLIRTVISGASIINHVLLCIDGSKGIQTQTAECIVLTQIILSITQITVVINKIDLLTSYDTEYAKLCKQIKSVFNETRFRPEQINIVAVSAINNNVDQLLQSLYHTITIPSYDRTAVATQPFLMQVDHCFQVKGAGSVLTGTVLSGCITVNDDVEIPTLGMIKRIKSIQSFKQSINTVHRGDRAAICVTQLDTALMEYGLVATPHTVKSYRTIICTIQKIKFYKQAVQSKQKYHVTVGHITTMATLYLFCNNSSTHSDNFDWNIEYRSCRELTADTSNHTYAIVTFDHAVHVPDNTILIGSRLDVDVESKSCRLAFVGHMVDTCDTNERQLIIVKYKQKTGMIDRIEDHHTVIVRELFHKNVDLHQFLNYNITYQYNDTVYTGRIESTFGTTGKLRCRFSNQLPCSTTTDAKGKTVLNLSEKQVVLKFKKYVNTQYSADQAKQYKFATVL